jgi:putative endonuclease
MHTDVPLYFVYIMTNRWKTVLYTGVTNSLAVRVWQHKHKVFAGFTKKYNCDRLVYRESYDRVEAAIAREKQIKGWTRAKKDALITARNPEWEDLAAAWYPED